MARIGEPDLVPAVDHEITGLVVVLAVEQRIDRDQPSVLVNSTSRRPPSWAP